MTKIAGIIGLTICCGNKEFLGKTLLKSIL